MYVVVLNHFFLATWLVPALACVILLVALFRFSFKHELGVAYLHARCPSFARLYLDASCTFVRRHRPFTLVSPHMAPATCGVSRAGRRADGTFWLLLSCFGRAYWLHLSVLVVGRFPLPSRFRPLSSTARGTHFIA